MKLQQTITRKLEQGFDLNHLEVINESHKHNVPDGSESHFKVVIVSDDFSDKALLARHRMVNKVLADELNGDIHALALHTITNEEWSEKNATPDSPLCLGGDGVNT